MTTTKFDFYFHKPSANPNFKFTFFISYRVNTESDPAKMLYLLLNDKQIPGKSYRSSVFLDKQCFILRLDFRAFFLFVRFLCFFHTNFLHFLFAERKKDLFFCLTQNLHNFLVVHFSCNTRILIFFLCTFRATLNFVCVLFFQLKISFKILSLFFFHQN